MITSDPLAIQLSLTVLHSTIKNEHLTGKHGAADDAVLVLRRWIRAMSMAGNVTPSDGNGSDPSGPVTAPVYVTLAQAAEIYQTPKNTLYDWKADGKLPAPDVPHSGRRPAKWIWSKLRPKLERMTGMELPKCPPREPGDV